MCITPNTRLRAKTLSKVIPTNNRYGQRLCLEAWHINMSNHALNRDDGAYVFARGIHASHWQVTSSLGYLRSHDCNFRSPRGYLFIKPGFEPGLDSGFELEMTSGDFDG